MGIEPTTGGPEPSEAPPGRLRTTAVESKPPFKRRVRSWLAVILVVISGVLGPVALVANWAETIVTDEDAYIQAVAPLATDPAVTAALEQRLVDGLLDAVDRMDAVGQLEEFLAERDVPERVADAISIALGALSGGIRDVVSRKVESVLESPAFAVAWERANRLAHQQFAQAMAGQGNLVDSSGNLALQLEPVLVRVRDKLVDQGHAWAANIPTSSAEYVLLPADDVSTIRSYYSRLGSWSVAVLIAALCALAGSVMLTPDRRHGAARAFGVIAAGGTVLGLLVRLGADGLSRHARSPEAAQAIFSSVTAGLVGWIRLMVLLSLLIAGLAALWSFGNTRTQIMTTLVSVRKRLSSPPLLAPKRAICGLLALAGALVLLFVESLSPTATGIVVLVVLVAVVVAFQPAHQLHDDAET